MLKNQGFTLIEVMVAMGILSLGALAIAQYSMNSSRSSKSNVLSGELTILVSNLQGVLGSSACTSVLENQPFVIGAANQIIAALPGGPVLAKAGFPTVGAQVTSLAFTNIIQDNVSVAGTLVEKVVNLELKAKKVVIQNETTPGTLGSQTITKEFPIAIWVGNGNTVVACSQSVQSAPPQPTNLTMIPSCVDVNTPFNFSVQAGIGTAYVLIQPEAQQLAYPNPPPSVAIQNPDFIAHPLSAAAFMGNTTTPFAPITVSNVTPGYNFYATAYNSANQGTVSSAITVAVYPAGGCP